MKLNDLAEKTSITRHNDQNWISEIHDIIQSVYCVFSEMVRNRTASTTGLGWITFRVPARNTYSLDQTTFRATLGNHWQACDLGRVTQIASETLYKQRRFCYTASLKAIQGRVSVHNSPAFSHS